MATRREFLKTALVTGTGLALYGRAAFSHKHVRAFNQPNPGGTLDPRTIPKYRSALFVPPTMPRAKRGVFRAQDGVDDYEVSVRQIRQHILPPGMPATAVWAYGAVGHPDSFHTPGCTMEGRHGRPVRVRWVNELRDAQGRFRPHVLPVDPTLHWANPPGGRDGRDMQPRLSKTPGRYLGPVPICNHLHGGHSQPEADGNPEAWVLPAAGNIPNGYARVGSRYEHFRQEAEGKWGDTWSPGSSVYRYENDQRATTLWYHDHTLGLTRVNIYAGMAGFYLLRGGPEDLVEGMLPGGSGYGHGPHHEIPLLIQDRSFNADGSLFYPDTRAFFDGFTGPYLPRSDVPPIWNPEVFGNTIMVNGRTWPYLDIEPRRYRLRFVNGCNARFLILKLATNALAARPAPAVLPFWQIGADGGFLAKPVSLHQLLLGPSERADVIVDFTGMKPGTTLHLINEGPDEPFGGGIAGLDFPAADRRTTGQVLRLRVVPRSSSDRSVDPAHLQLPAVAPLGEARHVRRVSLNEAASTLFDGPVAGLLGTLDAASNPVTQTWMDPVTETPLVNRTELWEIHNFTEDAHPIHIHQVQFQVVDRQDGSGRRRAPEAWETGYKDTLIAYPDEVTRFKVRFDLPGLYVWHCHILEHEDREMMRPLLVRTR